MNRVRERLNASLDPHQFGFRPGRGTPDAIFTLRRLHEVAARDHTPLYAAYIDLSKAFDSVNRAALWRTLHLHGIAPALLARLQSLYLNCTASVRVGDCKSAPFPMSTGVRQGCPLSPLLFNVYMDVVTRSLARSHQGGFTVAYSINGRLVTPPPRTIWSTATVPYLLYADDIVLLSHSIPTLTAMLNTLEAICGDLALTINYEKTEIQGLGHRAEPMPPTISTASGNTIKSTPVFRYLGSLMSSTDHHDLDAEISRRISSAANNFRLVSRRIWSSHDVSTTTKIQLYNSLVMSILLYACETWTLRQEQLQRLEVFHNRCIDIDIDIDLHGHSASRPNVSSPQPSLPER
jgi:hypothetical protein